MFEKSPKVDILSKLQTESTVGRRIKSSLKWLSRIIQKNDFSPPNLRKKIKPKYPKKIKTRNIGCRTLPPHLVYQILGWYIYFRQIFSPETVSVDDAIFRTAIWSISRHRTEIKMAFLKSSDQICWETRILYSKIAVRKFDLTWPELTLPFSVDDLHGLRLQMASIFGFYVQKWL